MKTITFLGVVVALALGASSGFGHPDQHEQKVAQAALQAFAGMKGSLDIAGGTAHIPVMTEAAKRIIAFNPEIRITITGGGSGVGVQKVGEGLVQIGNAGRALSKNEIKKYGLKSYPFAIDGVAAVVHPSNPVRELTFAQLKDAFAGKTTNWKELGGPDLSINLYGRDEASGTRKVFWTAALGKGDIAASANVVPSNGAMKTAVGRDPGALGYLSIGHVDQSVVALKLDEIEASQKNVQSGKYTVTRKLYMNTKGEPTGLTKAFIEYIQGPACVKLIQEKGYIPGKK
jgi:phosphate transport system substrate-binding protein